MADPGGRYQIEIPLIDERIPGNTNEVPSRMQFGSLFRRMKDEVKEQYDTITEELPELGIMKETPVESTGKRILTCLASLL